MSKKNKKCCEEVCCCNNSNVYGNNAFGLNSAVTPIIFLLIACGSGLLRNNCSYLIILLFLLCGGCYGNLFGTNNANANGCCCEDNCCDCCC